VKFAVGKFLTVTLGLLLSLQSYEAESGWVPDKPVNLYIGSGKGDAIDLVTRVFAVELEKLLGQKITIINRSG
jgi:tripartite-type tricarboxylate transporter receptor subunit TctC